MARTQAALGDTRRDERAEWMLDRIVATGSLVLREIGGAEAKRAFEAMMGMRKIDVAAIMAARRG